MSNVQTSPLSRLLKPLISPPIFDFWARQFNPAMAWDRVLARVVERHVEARDSVTLVLKPNRNFRGFTPGQHVNVTAEVNGVHVTRSYSLTNVPSADGRLSITAKHIEGGKLSTQLCLHTQVGGVLELGAAFGNMVLPAHGIAPVVFLAAGSGITPLMGLTRSFAAEGMPVETTLIYWARSRDELCFAEELRMLAARHPRFRVHFVLTREQDVIAGELTGRPSDELLSTLVPDLEQRAVYACGPSGFVETVRALAAYRALAFQSEAFTPPSFASTALGTVRVELRASQRVLELAAGQPLLAALEAQGINLPSGCRMGICNTCACGKLAGTTQNLQTGASSTEPQSALRLCISGAQTDLTLDL